MAGQIVQQRAVDRLLGTGLDEIQHVRMTLGRYYLYIIGIEAAVAGDGPRMG